MPVRRHFLPWDRPLLPQAVAFLAGDWDGRGPLDLSRTLAVVATRQAGRRLRSALAEHAATRGQAVFPPRIVLPERLAFSGEARAGAAGSLESLLAWVETLREADLQACRDVFPVDPPARDFAWARRLGAALLRLQAALAEGGLTLETASGRAGDFPEAARWAQLAALGASHQRALARRKLREPQAALIAAAEEAGVPDGVDRIALLAVPDPLPLAASLLERWSGRVTVDVAVFAPPALADRFDAWGRPRIEAWQAAAPDLPDFQRRVRLCADPAAQADRIVALARDYGDPEGALAVGIADPEVLPALETGLARAGLAAFNPEGRSLRRDGLYALLIALAEFAAEDSFASVSALLRCPDILEWLGRRAAAGFSPARLLQDCDDLRARHLPPTLAAALAQAADRPLAAEALRALAGLRRRLADGAFAASASEVLSEIFEGRRVASDSPLAEAAAVWRRVLEETAGALEAFPGLTVPESWELALARLAEERRFEDKPAGAIDLSGWLEVLWEDAPHLVVAGANDGLLPDAVTGDAFLPEALCARLGLKTNAARFARDAYLLQAAAAPRAEAGRLDLLVGKVSAAGDPLRPSRLLLQCPDAELPARVAFLFRELPAPQAGSPWIRPWRLQPRRRPPPKRLSVTLLRRYLECPFRFYLEHVLEMRRLDLDKAELDALDFGTLVHAALQRLGEDAALRDSADPERLRAALLDAFDGEVAARYGGEPSLPLTVQFEAARQRLRHAADLQARQRSAGWRIEKVEWSFARPIGGIELRGKIDRIERHEKTGQVRLLDYKTTDTAKSPADVHLAGLRDKILPTPDWQRAPGAGAARRWIDLQLPLYRLAAEESFGPGVACGYFNLPKAASDTALKLWDDYTPALHASALACAEGLARAVSAGDFWPPAELRDDANSPWADLFHRGAADSVEQGAPA